MREYTAVCLANFGCSTFARHVQMVVYGSMCKIVYRIQCHCAMLITELWLLGHSVLRLAAQVEQCNATPCPVDLRLGRTLALRTKNSNILGAFGSETAGSHCWFAPALVHSISYQNY
jgi:hypothetical protein